VAYTSGSFGRGSFQNVATGASFDLDISSRSKRKLKGGEEGVFLVVGGVSPIAAQTILWAFDINLVYKTN
jgi:hypothetical protein